MAEQMNTQNLLQLVQESAPGTYDPNGASLVMVSAKGEFAPNETWATFRPMGFNEDAWAALEATHRVWSGTINWDFLQAPTFLQMLCGAPITDITADSVRTRTFQIPESGARNLTGSTFTVEYGLQGSCDRCPYGLLLSITLPAERTANTVAGNVSIICQAPISSGVPMTGTTAQPDIFTVGLANQDTEHDVTIGGSSVAIATDETASSLQTKIQAIGGDWTAATVTSA